MLKAVFLFVTMTSFHSKTASIVGFPGLVNTMLTMIDALVVLYLFIDHNITVNLVFNNRPSIEGSLGYIPNRGQMPYRGITAMINIPPIIPLFGDYIGEYP